MSHFEVESIRNILYSQSVKCTVSGFIATKMRGFEAKNKDVNEARFMLRICVVECEPFFSPIALLIIGMIAFSISGCSSFLKNDLSDRLYPSNQRDWTPSLSRHPTVEIQENVATIRNVRNCDYLSEEEYTLHYNERQYDLNKIQSVDFVVVPFKPLGILAHTMLSFGFEDDEHLMVSAEIRTEKGESYSPILGITRQFELAYVVADEKDLVRLRTEHRDADVYIYPTKASPQESRELFIDVMGRVNKLAEQPEFYHTLTNNCTTNIAKHVNRLKPEKVSYHPAVLLPGLSARYAYQKGLLDQSLPFNELKNAAKVNRLAEIFYDSPDFSRKIRNHLRIATSHQQLLGESALVR